MFVSVMAVFHERLPCAKYYFRQRRKFKEKLTSLLKAFDERERARLAERWGSKSTVNGAFSMKEGHKENDGEKEEVEDAHSSTFFGFGRRTSKKIK